MSGTESSEETPSLLAKELQRHKSAVHERRGGRMSAAAPVNTSDMCK